METWSLVAEFLAFIIIITIGLYFYQGNRILDVKRNIFGISLQLAAGSILLNAVCVFTIAHYASVPHWLNVFLNSGYFLLSVWMCSILALYLFELILEHVYCNVCRNRAYIGLSLLTGGYTLLVITNVWNQSLFWFDEAGIYHKGPLNLIGYGVLFIELAMVVICYINNRKSISKDVRQVIQSIPFVLALLMAFQYAYPDILFNGTMIAFVELILFVNFQNHRSDENSLAGLGNRKNFYEELSLCLSGNQRIQVIMVALKDFMLINQKYGYQQGDVALSEIACWLKEFQRESRAFRFGNVTFALLCGYETPEQAEQNLQRIQTRFADYWQLEEACTVVPACFAELVYEQQKWDATEMVELLVYMVERAKQSDTCVLHFGDGIIQDLQHKKEMILLLRDAIANRKFQVWYQPVYDVKQQGFFSAEALLRLRDDKGNMVSPAEFIPLAEEEGLIDDISWIVLEEICRFLGAHKELPLQSISMNLSMQQFVNESLCDLIKNNLSRYQVPVSKLKLEITERVILYDQAYMRQMMQEMTAQGIGFYLDDFGTGYSNFSTVMHLPFECIKLDRSLFSELLTNAKDRLIVQTMMKLFHGLGMEVVSEGIETQEQLDLIRDLGTDRVQGYFYTRPMCEEDLLHFYQKLDLEDECS